MVGTARRRTLVLSDHKGFSRAIEVNLTSRLELDIFRFGLLERRRIQVESGESDLIVCRHLATYFMAEVKGRLYRRFHDALCPGGVLCVGGTECLSQASDMGVERRGISFHCRSDA